MTQLQTTGGRVYTVEAETEHYILCSEPSNRGAMTAKDALRDFEDLYQQGFKLAGIGGYMKASLFFEKITIGSRT